MFGDADAAVILTARDLAPRLPSTDAPVVLVDGPARPRGEPRVSRVVDADCLAYVIYTSGSTGVPNGAMNGHRGLANRIAWMQSSLGLGPGDVVLHKTPITFDVSVWELFLPLVTGACLVVARPGGHRDSGYLVRTIISEGVSIVHFVPPMLQAFLDEPQVSECRSLRYVVCSGEALPWALKQRCEERLAAELHNLYGPTEAAIDVTAWRCDRRDTRGVVAIGRPIANLRTYVLDAELAPVPIGVPGELYLGGVGVGRGYLGRPRLTAERFVPDPFAARPGERLYRTGDLVRHRHDGNLEFLGRLDHQVKLRGVRIELGEIEAALRGDARVRDCVVVLAEGPGGDPLLAAYVTSRGEGPLVAAQLREELRRTLPEALVPAAVVVLAALPLSPNGKIDRRALPPVVATPPAAATTAPRTALEATLVRIFCEVLGVTRVGIDDDFFALGGHSLMATRVTARMRATLGVAVPLRWLFEAPRIAALAPRVEELLAGGARDLLPPLVRRDETDEPELSFAQQRLWFLDRLEPESAAYTLFTGVRLRGRLDADALEQSLQALVRRHEALRTAFPVADGRPRAVVRADGDVRLRRVESYELSAAAWSAQVEREAAREAARPFVLADGPLLRATLLSRSDDEHVFLLAMHHIVADEWSMGILMRELAELYAAAVEARAPRWPELPIQYADFARWQRRWLADAALERQLAYWRGRLAGSAPALGLPTDRPRPPVQTFRGDAHAFRIAPALVRALGQLGASEGATLFMTLLCGFAALLQRYSGQDDFVVGTPIANRPRPELESLIGFFVNMLPLRVEPAAELPFRELLRRVRDRALEAYANQDVPFDRLVEELRLPRDLARSPVFQVMIALHNTPAVGLGLPGVALEPLRVPQSVAKLDLTLWMTEDADGLACSLEYNTDLFDGETIARMSRHLVHLLEAATAAPATAIVDLDLIDDEERRDLLVRWNDTRLELAGPLCIHAAFDEAAQRSPQRVAVVGESGALVYRQLQERANRLAHHLRARGAGPDRPIAIYLERSPEMLIALLAVLKSGSAYLPLDVALPAERRELMLADSRAELVLTHTRLAPKLAPGHAVVRIDAVDLDALPAHAPDAPALPQSLAYVIYTSGSTGRPKGVMVEHHQVSSFFAAMDRVLTPAAASAPGVWLSLTSLSFDISVLELLWTVTRGFTVVLQREPSAGRAVARRQRPLDIGLFYFANDENAAPGDKYRLLLEGAKQADEHGFSSVWIPERHFHPFGGIYPNPAVVAAAVAATTRRVAIRAGSVVLPLHDPIRVAEEWAVVDNLSRGRVGLSVASGWHAVDFVLAPDRFDRRREIMHEHIDTLRRLWRGEAVRRRDGAGREVEVVVHPRPVSAELPLWITAAGDPATFVLAGTLGANLLTHLLGQSLTELEHKIRIYRDARRAAGHAGPGQVTLMIHTFIDPDGERARALIREPFTAYLASSLDLMKATAQGATAEHTPGERDALLAHAFDRYYETSSLFGTPAQVGERLDEIERIGVDEVGCLIDFGVAPNRVLDALGELRDPGVALRVRGGTGEFAVHLHGAARILRHPAQARDVRRGVPRVSGDREPDLHVRGARPLSPRAPGVPALSRRHPGLLRDGSDGGLFRRDADAGAVLDRHAAGADRRPRRDRAAPQGRRVSLADDEPHPRLRRGVPASGDPHPARAGRHHHLRPAPLQAALFHRRRFHHRRRAHAARRAQPNVPCDPPAASLRGVGLVGAHGRAQGGEGAGSGGETGRVRRSPL